MNVNKTALYAIVADLCVLQVWFEKDLGAFSEAPAPKPQDAQTYYYKYAGEDIVAGDIVLVVSPQQNIQAARVIKVHRSDVLDSESNITYKWAIGKINADTYLQTIAQEEAFLEEFEAKKRANLRQQLIQGLNLESLAASIKSPALESK